MTVPREFQILLRRTLACILSDSPPVVAAYDSDFKAHVEKFAAFARANRGTAVLLQLGYEHETPELAKALSDKIAEFLSEAPGARAIALCNSFGEMDALGSLGVETRHIHQNCFLDERRYRPMGRARPYAAAYVSRLTPCKRHELMPHDMAGELLLMGCATKIYDSERAYADMVYSRYAGAKIVPTFSGARISEWLGLARCGLILSPREGASFCSSEYFLCGLPVVDTPSIGGREVLYPDEFAKFVEPTEDSVREGILHWTRNRPDPWRVRAAWIEKARPHREAYRALMRELTGRDPSRAPHKLALRTPHPGALHSFAIQAYLIAKGLTMK